MKMIRTVGANTGLLFLFGKRLIPFTKIKTVYI